MADTRFATAITRRSPGTARPTPKNAFDLYQIAMTYDGGSRAAIDAFAAEKGENAGYEQACASLRKHFSTAESGAAHRCAAF